MMEGGLSALIIGAIPQEAILRAYLASPLMAYNRWEWRLERRRKQESDAAILFATVAFLCDGLLSLPLARTGAPVTFFYTCTRLPPELQMMLCNRANELGAESIAVLACTKGLRTLASQLPRKPRRRREQKPQE